MNRLPWRDWGAGTLSVLGALLLWELAVRSGLFDERVFPPPTEISGTLIALLGNGTLVRDSLVSLLRVAVGYVIGGTLGIGIGVLTGTSAPFRSTLAPIVQLLRPITPVALAPLAIVFFGLTEGAKYFLVAWGVFFAVWVSSHVGVTTIDRRIVWAAKALGASEWRLKFFVYPWAALPIILSGLRTAIGIGFICVVVAEMTGSGATAGLGYRVRLNYELFRVDRMIAALVVLGILGAAVDRIFAILSRRLFPWIEMRWI